MKYSAGCWSLTDFFWIPMWFHWILCLGLYVCVLKFIFVYRRLSSGQLEAHQCGV